MPGGSLRELVGADADVPDLPGRGEGLLAASDEGQDLQQWLVPTAARRESPG